MDPSCQIFIVKLILLTKMGLAVALSIANGIFGRNLFENIYCLSSLILHY